MNKRAIVLLSGGLDSTTTLAIAKSEGYNCYAISFRYGQRHELEIQQAKCIAQNYGVIEHKIIDIGLQAFGGSALTDNRIDVPKRESSNEIDKQIPLTYVPARNTIFLSFALAYAETKDADTIFIGVNVLDYSGYPDCRLEYIKAYQKMANLAIKKAVEGKIRIKIRTPLINMTKAEIIKTGIELGVDYSLTHSCYDPDENGKACGRCDSCLLRKKGFEEAGIKDPTQYYQ